MLKRVELDLQRAVSFPRHVEILHSLFEVSDLFSQTIVLTRLHLELLLDLSKARLTHVKLCLEMVILAVFLLHHFLNAINFHLSDINFVLVLQQLHFSLVVRFLLRGRYAIKLHIHVLDLFRLGVVNVGSSSDVLVALLNLELGCLVLFSRITLRFFCFGQLNFDVTK